MKRITTFLFALLLIFTFTSCNKNTYNPADDPVSEQYDWAAARTVFIKEIVELLKITASGTVNEYRTASIKWMARIVPDAFSLMFIGDPPDNCSSSVTYGGYSSPDFNSEGAEYLSFNVRRMNNETLASIDWKVTVRLDKGTDGYYIADYIQEVVK